MCRSRKWTGSLIAAAALGASAQEGRRAGWSEADVRPYLRAYFENFSSPLQLLYLRIQGTFGYSQALDVHLGEAVAGETTPEDALRATAVGFEEITIRHKREKQLRSYRTSLGLRQ